MQQSFCTSASGRWAGLRNLRISDWTN
jgi:hypothetical protein